MNKAEGKGFRWNSKRYIELNREYAELCARRLQQLSLLA